MPAIKSSNKSKEKGRLLSDETAIKVPYGATDDKGDAKPKLPERKVRNATLLDLYRYLTPWDSCLFILGIIFSIVSGAGWPFISFIFGNMSDVFMRAQNSPFAKGYTAPRTEIITYSNNTTAFVPLVFMPTISRTEFEDTVIQYSFYYVYVAAAVMLASYIQVACWLTISERQMFRLRREFFKSVMRQQISYYDKHQSGELTSKLNDDLDRIKEGIGDKVGILLQSLSQFFTGIIIALIQSWELSLVMLSLSPLIVILGGAFSKVIANASKVEQQKYGEAGGIAEEALSCIRTVMAFNGQKHEAQRYEAALETGRKLGIKKQVITGINLTLMFMVVFATYSLSFWYGSKMISENKIERGSVFSVFLCVMMGTFSLGNTAPQLSTIAGALGSASNIYDIIDTKPTIDPYSKMGKKPRDIKTTIEFKDVVFNYPSRPDVPVLTGLSFEANPGESVALVGSSGCGKSTVVNLLLRYYDALGGKILIGGESIKEINVRYLRKMIAVVSQEPILFDASIAENIRYGNKKVTESEMIDACKQANAHEFITKLPHAYDTLVGERGAQISGGQKQRIAIARALVRDPKILLLDEATSALDAESEGIVQEALEKAQKGRTTIIIAHRLSTIRSADKIISLKDGTLSECGTHQELMAQQGLYFTLVNSQTFEDIGYETQNTGTGDEPDTEGSTGNKPMSKKRRKSSRRISSTSSRTSSEPSQATSLQRRKLSRMLSNRELINNERERLEKEVKEQGAEIPTVSKIFGLARPEFCYIVLGLFGAVLRGVVMPAFAFIYSGLFKIYSLPPDEMMAQSVFWSMMFLVIGVVNSIGSMSSIYYLGYAGESLTMRLRMEVFKTLLRQDGAYFDDEKHATGKLTTRLSTDAPAIKAAVDYRFSSVLSSVVSMAAGVVIAFIYGWKMALAVLAMLPILGLAGFVNVRIRVQGMKKDNTVLEEAGKTASEAIENIRTVQSLTRELTFYETFCNHLEKPYISALKNAHLQAMAYAFAQSTMFFMYAAAYRFGAYLVGIGDIAPLDVFQVFFAISFSGMTLGWATSYFPEYAKAQLSAALIGQILGTKPKIDVYSNAGLRPELNGKITFRSVFFAYPSRPTVGVLKGLSLSVNEGETLALVGASGCGKSTVVSLIERIYDIQDGRIQLDDYDTKTMNVSFLREQISLVSQEPVLFDCSIRDNIIYGLERNISYEQIVESAKLSNIHDFIISLPEGYDTRVGEKGTQLSGGQKQRVAIARALVRKPKMLLLDEATSALDTESERIVQDALDRARAGRTCIVIAHRLSTVQQADKIAVVRKGKVVELGNHSELVAKRGVYYQLTKKQNLIKEE